MTSIEIAPLNLLCFLRSDSPSYSCLIPVSLSPPSHRPTSVSPFPTARGRHVTRWSPWEKTGEMRPRRQVQHLDRNHLDVPLQWTSQWRGSTDARERGPSEGGLAERGARAPRPVRSLIRRRNRHKQGRDSTGYRCITKFFFNFITKTYLSSHF